MRGILLGILFCMDLLQAARAQAPAVPVSYSIAGSVYSQTFDGLPLSGTFSLTGKGPFNLSASPVNGSNLNGWQVFMPAGSNPNAAFLTGTGSGTGNGIYSLGSTGSAERALGSLSSSTGIYAMGLLLTNTSGTLLNSFTLGFTAEQWRKGGSANKNTWTFRYKTGVITHMDATDLVAEPNLNFSSVVTSAGAAGLNGNLPENQQAVSFTVTGIAWKNGEQLVLRWDDADETGNDDAMALDNISFSAVLLSSAPVIGTISLTNISSRSATLTGMVNDRFANTSVLVEYDSVADFSHPLSMAATPATIAAGSGNTSIAATLPNLAAGKTYYARIKAINNKGIAIGSVQSFTTRINLPVIKTIAVSQITRNSAMVSAQLLSEGDVTITEKGIAWSLTETASLLNKKTTNAAGTGIFSETLTGLPQGTVLYARAYAIHAGGIVYGDSIRFTTATMVSSFRRSAAYAYKTNNTTVAFILQTEQPVSGFSPANFMLVSSGISGTAITGITGSSNNYIINIATGTGDGKLGLQLVNDSDLSLRISNQPCSAAGDYLIDKSPPQINRVIIPDRPMKINDTVMVTLFVYPDADTLTMVNGSINNFALTGFSKQNDSMYAAKFIVSAGGNDSKAEAPVPVTIILSDSLGNTSNYQLPIVQPADAIDANKPFITAIQNPVAKTYIAGDSLHFMVRFSEKISIANGIPSLTLTIGTRSRSAVYINGNGSDSLMFRYIIANGDLDRDGIKTAGTITLNNASIKDLAGNTATLSFTNTNGTKNILVDGIIPSVTQVTVPVAAEYKTGNLLDFIVAYTRKVWVWPGDSIPYLLIAIGNKTRPAYYVNGSGTNALMFRYMLQKDDVDTDGIKLNNNIMDGSRTIIDSVGNHALAQLAAIGNMAEIRVNTPTIAITGITVPPNGNYKAGDSLIVLVNYNEKVFVSGGVPSIKLTVGTAAKQALYKQGSGTNTLRFSYLIQQGDKDKDGITLNPAILLNNGNINDEKANNAPLLFTVTDNTSGIRIDGIAPRFADSSAEKFVVCENSYPFSIANALAITDEESGETIYWKIKNNPRLGSLSITEYSDQSAGKKITPHGFDYTPLPNNSGIDSLLVEISDGINTARKNIFLSIQPLIKNNFIKGSQVICIEQTASPLQGEIPMGGDGFYQYAWDLSTDSSRFALAAGNSNTPQFNPPLLQSNSWYRRRIMSGACSDTSPTIKITVLKNGIWTGNKNSFWNEAANWCMNQLPTATTDIRIGANTIYQPLINDTARCNRLLLATNAHLAITGVLQLSADMVANDHSIEATAGTLLLNGINKQYLDGSLFEGETIHNLVLNNASGIALTNELRISGKLLLNNGFLETNDQLFLKNQATIPAAAAGTRLIGKAIVEHVLEGGKRNFRLVGNPFAEPIALQMIGDSLDITGNNGSLNGFVATATNQPSAFHLDPLLGNDSTGIDAGWTAFTHTNGINENAWKSNEGIRLFFRGKPGQGLDGRPAGDGRNGTYLPMPVTLRLSGNLQYGDQEILLRKDAYAGYHAIANPYISNIDLSRITRANTVNRYYWLWNPHQGRLGGYTAYPFRTKQVLAPFGAFITRANGNGLAGILFSENSKTEEKTTDSTNTVMLDDIFYIELRLESDSIFWDRIVLFAMDSARNYYDRNDAEKIMNNEVNFYSMAAGQKKLSIDARPLTNESVVPLGIQSDVQGSFVIRVAKALLPVSNTLMLHDNLSDTWTKLETDSSYRFYISQDTITSGDQRFEIASRRKTGMPAPEKPSISTKLSPVPAKDKLMIQFSATEKGNTSIRLLTLSGKPVKTMQLGIQQGGQINLPLEGIKPGIYLIELQCGNQRTAQKIIKD